MAKTVWIAAFAVAMILTVGKAESLAQFGRGLGGIFGGARSGRGGENRQNQNSQVNRLVPDSYQETQHNLMMMKTDLQLTPEQEAPWSTISDKVMVYASELSMERARIGISESQRTAVTGLQYIDQATAGARTRVTELEDIRNAANVLYGTFTSDQKKIADARMASVISPQPDAQGGGTPPHYP